MRERRSRAAVSSTTPLFRRSCSIPRPVTGILIAGAGGFDLVKPGKSTTSWHEIADARGQRWVTVEHGRPAAGPR